MTLLIVEDSRGDRLALEHGIRSRFSALCVGSADSLAAARATLDANGVSVGVVDLLLPDGNGLELVEGYPAVSWIVVTGTGSEQVAAEALRKGAFDYVVKKEAYRHLVEVTDAIEAALAERKRRPERDTAAVHDALTKVIRFGDFELALRGHELRERGEPRAVHRTPMRLLVYLARNADRTVPKQELLDQVWEGTAVSDTAIASALKELRHVLRDDGAQQRVIQTRRGYGYRFVAPVSLAAAGASGPPSLAVLPLENLSNDPEQDYFALGMTDALISALARLDSLRVMSRMSVMHLRDCALSPREIGRELGADLLVSGSVARDGAHARISAELLDLRSGHVLWAGRYDRAVEDVLTVESEVAQAIAREIHLDLTPQERARLHRRASVAPAAVDAFLMGRYRYRIYTRESVAAALEHFLRAVECSPSYAAAHVAIAECYEALCSEFGAISADEAIPRARSAADRALELDTLLGEAHAARGALHGYFEWHWREAESAFLRAVELSPGDPSCLMGLAKLSAALGRHEAAIDLARRALASDPLNLPLRLNLARVLWCARRYDEALAEQSRVAAMEPGMALAHLEAGLSLHHLGRYREAVERWLAAMPLRGISAEVQQAMRRAFERGGIGAYWRRWLALADRVAREIPVPASWMWLPYAAVGDHEHAFEWLERDVERRAEGVAFLKVSPSFDALRGHPRFQQLLRRMGLPEEPEAGRDSK